MEIDKKHSKPWVKVTIWVLTATLIFVWMGAGIWEIIANRQAVSNDPATSETPTEQTLEQINANYESALTSLISDAKAAPDDAAKQVAVGSAYLRWAQDLSTSQDASAAIQAFTVMATSMPYWEAAYKLDPKDKQVAGDYATALYYSGDSARAIKIAEKTLKANPDYATVWFNLGLYKSATDTKGAIKAFEEAKKIDATTYGTSADEQIKSLKESTQEAQ